MPEMKRKTIKIKNSTRTTAPDEALKIISDGEDRKYYPECNGEGSTLSKPKKKKKRKKHDNYNKMLNLSLVKQKVRN